MGTGEVRGGERVDGLDPDLWRSLDSLMRRSVCLQDNALGPTPCQFDRASCQLGTKCFAQVGPEINLKQGFFFKFCFHS